MTRKPKPWKPQWPAYRAACIAHTRALKAPMTELPMSADAAYACGSGYGGHSDGTRRRLYQWAQWRAERDGHGSLAGAHAVLAAYSRSADDAAAAPEGNQGSATACPILAWRAPGNGRICFGA